MYNKQSIHLICNAHLDPVWQWQWEEGAAEAVSTFRVAAEFCELYDGFVFNHNEVILYEWVQEYEPQLFKRIQKLVQQGKWKIMGGWFLQPDCNLPSGESFVRQTLLGREYFKKHFGVVPKVAINFDPFGHTRGLVQILAKSGYEGYMYCRPLPNEQELPDNYFRWVGFDGSEVIGCRAGDMYPSLHGTAINKIKENLVKNKNRDAHFILWGIGNHGGGPSRVDVEGINDYMAKRADIEIKHSSPDDFINDLKKPNPKLPKFERDLNPWAVGCYTSMILIKQLHRKLENEMFLTEKMVATAAAQEFIDYPKDDLYEVQRDLAVAQFHDILPGTAIQPAEKDSVRIINHGLEILSRLKTHAFFALASGQPKAKDTDIPVLVYNPHPYKVKTMVECEYQLGDQNRDGTFTNFNVYHNGKKIPAQLEKEESNIPIDWRKHIVFHAELKPGCMNRFDCRPESLPQKPKHHLKANKAGIIKFDNGSMKIHISTRTGLVEKYIVGGKNVLDKTALRPLVIVDNEDPWGMLKNKFRKVSGSFKPLNSQVACKFAGLTHLQKTLHAVRVIEDGPARTVIEALLGYDESKIVMHYVLPKFGTEFELKMRVYWNQKDTMLKLSVPMKNKIADYTLLGQVAYGYQPLDINGNEVVAQKWMAVVDKKSDLAMSCINNGTYAADFTNSELRLTLLRSPAYAAHPIEDRQVLPSDRFSPRIDQGERQFMFRFNVGKISQRINNLDRESLVANEKPFALSFFPSGEGEIPKASIHLSDKVVQLSAVKISEDEQAMIIRLFEPTGKKRKTLMSIPWADIEYPMTLGKFEIKTFRIDLKTKIIIETDLMENPLY
jgi:alpha-mannosidase